MKFAQPLILAATLTLVWGCGGTQSSAPRPSGVQVRLTTPSAQVSTSSTFQFRAVVTGATDNNVNWSVVGGEGNGTITQSGLYRSPSTPGTYQVVARSSQDEAVEGRATILVNSGINITLSPQNPTVKFGSDVQFSATITGPGSNLVSYQVLGQGTAGTISSSGLYVAPSTAGTFEILATSVSDPTRSFRTNVTVIPGVDVRITSPVESPVVTTVSKIDCAARVTGTTNTGITWSIPSGGGSITPQGLFTPPTSPGTVIVRATSAADPTVFSERSFTVTNQVQARVTVASKGEFVMRLATTEAPNTSANLVSLTNEGFYDGIIFHRYEPGFVIQGGDPLTKTLPLTDPSIGTGGPGYTIPFEANPLLHTQFALGMARSSSLDSGGSQWYIALTAQPSLDGQYVVFGNVTSGSDVVQQLRKGDIISRMRIEAIP